jgi:hypothetical protein
MMKNSATVFFFLWHAAKTYFLQDAKEKTHLFCIIFRLTVLGKIQDGGWNFFFFKGPLGHP